ncbi:uncharacterized protein [Dermacentor albipictus]|uniref:uncharacterized protein n=1 Tax=Dermacentor albipictus TaxID=60249 RepID=UPI0038FCABB8
MRYHFSRNTEVTKVLLVSVLFFFGIERACAGIQQRAVDNTRQLQDIETSAMAEESSNECMPLDLSMKAKATPSTAHDGTQAASSTLGAYRTISDDALRYPRNTQHTPTTKEICNVDGVTDNGGTRYQQLDSIRSINNVRPSTGHAGIEEESAKSEDGATLQCCLPTIDTL